MVVVTEEEVVAAWPWPDSLDALIAAPRHHTLRGGRTMKRIIVGSLVILGLWTSLSTGPVLAAPASAPAAVDIDRLFQHWVRSSEEERPGDAVQVFRPAASREFPPSRFRMAYKFARDGSCEWYFLSPDDAHRFKPGTWRLDASDKTLLRIVEDGTTISYRIVELSAKALRLAPVR
jgi:hypothetical protein